jgi:hypothetical protein
MNCRLIVLCLAFDLATIASAQNPPKKDVAKAPPPAVIDETTAYLLPVDEKLKIRDLQLEYSELEAQNQKLLVQVEQNKQRQHDVADAIRTIAYQFAQAKQIDLKVWEIDAKELKFVKKKATK